MKKFIICLMMLCSFGAYAAGENERVTSMGYVTEELATRQDKFDKLGVDNAMTYSGTTDGVVTPRAITGDLGTESNTSSTAIPTVGAVDTKLENKQDELDFAANTVLMNTGVAGEPAAKGIYDDTGSYLDQADSLIDAATFNAALQTAINSELSCAQRKDPNDPNSKCLLFNIFAPTQNLIIPAEYTRLEYIENNGTGAPWIDTGIYIDQDTEIVAKTLAKESGKFIYGVTTNVTASEQTRSATAYVSGSWGNWRFGDQAISVSNSVYYTYNTVHTSVQNKNGVTIDGVNVGNYTDMQDFVSPYPLALFGRRYTSDGNDVTSQSGIRIYEFKIYKNNALVLNLVPVKYNDNGTTKVAMYDTVSQTLKPNARTGKFTAGPELSSNIYLPMN